MQDDRTTANVKGLRDDDSASITADTPEAVRSDANTGKWTAATQSIPETSGPRRKQSAKTGSLARLLSKVSTDPMEILQALDDLSEMIAERVLRKTRAFRWESEAQHHVRDTKLDASAMKPEARTAARDAKIDARYNLYDQLDKQMRLRLVMVMIQSFFLGILGTLSLMHWFSV